MKDQNKTLNRRDVLVKGFAGALTLGSIGTAIVRGAALTPGVTEGPYWVDEMIQRSDVRGDPITGIVQVGFPLALEITVSTLHKGVLTPLKGAYADIWHCNAFGVYSDEAVEGTLGEKFLRGYQITNARGQANFITIYPGWYQGRTVHVHLRVRVYDAATDTVTYNFVTQMFFNDQITNHVYSTIAPYSSRPGRDTHNSTDSIFTGPSEDGEVRSESGTHLLLGLSETKRSATGKFHVVMDLSDAGYNNATGGNGGGPPLP